MNSHDQRLGMHRAISRRDFLNGVGVTIGAALLPGCSPAEEIASPYYPPLETGMRGSHAGSFETAHAAVKGQHWDAQETGEHYDLIVVGAGISGLSAAHIYRRDINPDARILILDNHDDFGGHAKRNEFELDGKTLIGFGGTMLIDNVKSYPEVSKQVFRDLGIEATRSDEFSQGHLFDAHKMRQACFLDKETFGADYLAVGSYGYSEAVERSSLSEAAKADLKRLYADEDDYLAGKSPQERRAIIEALSWRDYLEQHGGMGEEALTFIQKSPHGVWAIGADAFPAFIAFLEGYPGFAGMDLGLEEEAEEEHTRFHFPDGNATIARLLVRKLVPAVAPGTTMEDVVTERFDYSSLDRPSNPTRIRLSSTVVNIGHSGDGLTGEVNVAYVRDNEGQSVTAKKVIWAGYHAMLPHVCADIPAAQTAALGACVHAPLVYTSVLARNWKAFAKLGIRRAYCPGSFFHSVMPTFPVSIGDYQYARSPDEPVILHLQHIPTAPGLSAPDQFREGQRALFETPFEDFERKVRDQLGRLLGPGGFDPARDIKGITVNRWPHGYAYSVDEASADVAWWPQMWQHKTRPWEDARQRIGHIAIAGTGAASNAMSEAAIEEAHRAVHSLVS